MFLNLKDALSSIVTKALRFLGMAEPTTIYPELPVLGDPPLSIEVFCNLLQAWYSSGGTPRMLALSVSEVRLCKSSKPPEHEYITATVCESSGQFVAYISFERFRGPVMEESPSKDKPPSPSATPPSIPHTSESSGAVAEVEGKRSKFSTASVLASSRASSEFFLRARRAKDSVTNIPNPCIDEDDVCSILTFKGTPLPLWELAILAHVIHIGQDEYLLLSGNCYVYAGTIARVLKECYKPEIFDVPTKNPGKWQYIKIFYADHVDISPIVNKFEADKDLFVQPVREKDIERNMASNAGYDREARIAAVAAEERERQVRIAAEEREQEFRKMADIQIEREREARRQVEEENARLKCQLVEQMNKTAS